MLSTDWAVPIIKIIVERNVRGWQPYLFTIVEQFFSRIFPKMPWIIMLNSD